MLTAKDGAPAFGRFWNAKKATSKATPVVILLVRKEGRGSSKAQSLP